MEKRMVPCNLRALLLCCVWGFGSLSPVPAYAGEAVTGQPEMPPAMAAQDMVTDAGEIPEVVVVTATRSELIGQATTSSQGIILKEELNELPVYRAGQLLETVPGLVVTIHSGEGKANQYLLRGFNLDHGTDLATFIDGMPVNMRTHAHGQGYTDLNFFIPELATGINYSKGPYFASEGDYASVAAVHIGYVDTIADQATVTAGSFSYQRLFTAGTREVMNGRVMGGLELVHYDGPWTHPDNVRKLNAVVRYSQGEAREGFSITGMYYRGLWNATTDQPERAMDAAYASSIGIAPISRYGTLDPTDAGQTQRMSLSGIYSHGTLDWHVDANAYVINSNLTLWNNFTHYLDDPIQGDQHAQNDVRMIYGGGVSYTQYGSILDAPSETLVGAQARYDNAHVNRLHTQARAVLSTDVEDRVKEGSAGVYLQQTNFWTDWFRSIVGVREDYLTASDQGTNSGTTGATLFQPKGSLVVSPWTNWEFYVSAGQGFHSNDVRGSTTIGAPLLVKSTGKEIGVRATPFDSLTATVTLFQMEFASELTYDAEAGQTSAGRPSKRTGVEVNATYTPFDWLEFYGSVAFAHARFTDFDPAGGYIPDAPAIIGQLGIYVRNLGHWSGALNYRYLGHHALIEDNSQTSDGDQEWNMNVGYDFGSGWTAQLGIFNLFDSKDDAAEYYYGDRISPTEPLSDPAGNGDLHIHPLEPRAFRFTVSKTF